MYSTNFTHLGRKCCAILTVKRNSVLIAENTLELKHYEFNLFQANLFQTPRQEMS